MDRKNLIIVVSIFLLIMGSGVAFYFLFVKEPAAPAAELPKASDAASPFTRFPSDFRTTVATSAPAVIGKNVLVNPDAAEIKSGILRPLSVNSDGPTPMTGAAVFLKDKKTGAEAARYIERGTGHIYEANLATGEFLRITNTTIPKITESLWTSDGKGVYFRFLKDSSTDISTFYANLGSLDASSTATTIGGTTLAENIVGLAAEGTKAFLLGVNADDQSSFGLLQDVATKKKADTIWRSPLGEWNASWLPSGLISLLSKPSRKAPGFFYFLSPNTKRSEIILQDLLGLSAVPNADATKVLYSDTEKGTIETKLLTRKTGKSESFPVTTLAEKCVWSSLDKTIAYCAVPTNLFGNIPDEWYQGTVSFTDEIWKIETTTGKTTVILAADPKQPLDVMDPKLAPNEDYLVFTNKNDLVLWSLKLEK